MLEYGWEELFEVPSGRSPVISCTGRVVRKSETPRLFLPNRPGPAAATTGLYPAQTAKARLARALLKNLLRFGFPTRLPSRTLRLDSDDPFLKFLARAAGTGVPPQFGVLAGNPSTPGTRFILVVFGPRQTPIIVVKAGITPEARKLIEQEERFLQSLGTAPDGVPVVRDTFESPRVRAFASDFVAGASPCAGDLAGLSKLLEAWIHPERELCLSDTRPWQTLINAAAREHSMPILSPKFDRMPLRSVMCHGDLAPWNIKVSRNGSWKVLDWERGELRGVPCWDWFHYVLQPAILVKRLSAERLIPHIDALFGNKLFQAYCTKVRANGNERELLLGYLLHAIEVVKPSEGLKTTRELFNALLSRLR